MSNDKARDALERFRRDFKQKHGREPTPLDLAHNISPTTGDSETMELMAKFMEMG